MKKILLMLVSALFVLSFSGMLMAVDIAMEAEFAVIEEPMVIGVPVDAVDQGGAEPDEPSRGQFVWVPGPPATGGGGSGYVQFTVNIPTPGNYAVWGRVLAWDGNSDSFWVTWEPADPAENPQETENTEYRWGVAGGATWHWDKINQWLDGGTFERSWELPAGPTILTVFTREDATMLDCIFITDNLSDDEAEVGPRTPTDQDLQTTSVTPGDKLAVTWGSVRANK
ncbi:hypothetical protein GF312_05530 [Candidatus Poribacteria bacterium]|nr:hypothetical protein [Candidatus Poribacteria bacterium]